MNAILEQTTNARIEKIKEQELNEHLGVLELSGFDGIRKIKAVVNNTSTNPSGYYHGGVIYALCDICAICGLSSLIDDDKEAVTHDIHVSIMRAATQNDEVIYQSKVTKLGKRMAFVDVEAKVNGKLIATARVTKSIL